MSVCLDLGYRGVLMKYLPFALLLLATPATAQGAGCNPSGINGCPQELRVPVPEPRPVIADAVTTRDKKVKPR